MTSLDKNEAATTCSVRLTTTSMSTDVEINEFQFGTVPAPAGSFDLTATSVVPGSTDQEVFWFDRDIAVPTGQVVRFNLRFELNVHNSANLQVSINPPGAGGAVIEWRWSAPVGYVGTWSSAEQQAPWYDDGMDYCINIQPDGSGISVTLSERSGTEQQQCPFIPPQPGVTGMVRPT